MLEGLVYLLVGTAVFYTLAIIAYWLIEKGRNW